MPRKPSRKTLIKKLDKVFSEYIRKRDTDKNGYGLCCTCAKRLHYKEGHAGHFALFLNDLYKTEKATELLIKSRETVKYSLDELEDMIKYFKKLLT